MTTTTSAGTALAISVATPATYDATGFAALTFTEVGNVEKLGPIGPTYAKVEFQPLKGPKQKRKGSADYGSLSPNIAIDESDAGQALMRTAGEDETNKLYSFMVTYPSGAKRYFQGQVFGWPENTDSADTMFTVAPTVEISTKIVKVTAPAS